MNARSLLVWLASALLTVPAMAFACTDAGPPNRSCNDGGARWIGCTDHAQCPAGQHCTAQGACGCGERDAGVCDDAGCHACLPRSVIEDAGYCWRPAFFCPEPAADAGGGGGCSVRAPGDRSASGPFAAIAAVVGVAVFVRRRRSSGWAQ